MPSRRHGEEASGNGEVEEREEGVFEKWRWPASDVTLDLVLRVPNSEE